MKKQSALVNNMLFNAIYRCVYILFPIITIPYLSRVIFADGIGKVDFANSIVNYFLIFASLGIPQYGIREIAKRKDSVQELSKNFLEIFIINLISTMICVVIYYSMICFVPYFEDRQLLFAIMGITLLLNIFNVDWFFQGMEQYGYIAKRSIFVKALSLILIVVFVQKPEDYVIYAAINIFALSGNNILNMIELKNYIKLCFADLEISKHLKTILILLSTQMAITIYINLDTTMLGIFSGDTAVGIFTNASKLSKLTVVTITSISVVLLPRMSAYLKENSIEKINFTMSKMLELLLAISVPITVGMFLLSEDIVSVLFGPSFVGATITVKILAWQVVVLTIGNLFGTQVLMAFGQEKKLLISVVAGALMNFTLNMYLIPRFAENGAAVASLIAEMLVLILQVNMALRYVHININIKNFTGIIIGNLSIVIIIVGILLILPCGLSRLLVAVVCSSIFYLTVNIMSNNSIIQEMFLRLR